jgi:hypothetical protein
VVNDAVGAHSLFEKIFYIKGNGCCGFSWLREKRRRRRGVFIDWD